MRLLWDILHSHKGFKAQICNAQREGINAIWHIAGWEGGRLNKI